MRFVTFSYFYPFTQWEGNLEGTSVQDTETDQPACSLNPFPFLIGYISQSSMWLGAAMRMSFGPQNVGGKLFPGKHIPFPGLVP